MSKFQRSWLLFKSSFAVVTTHRRLLLFPIVITTLTLLIALLFLAPAAFQPTGHSYTSAEHWKTVVGKFYDTDQLKAANDSSSPGRHRYGRNRQAVITAVKPLGVAYFAGVYFASMFGATFFNVAFYNEILKALRGEAVSVRGGIRFACTKWKAILLWTAFAGIIGMIIRMLEERVGLIGKLVLRLVGAAWSVACVFVIPVLVTDEEATNPINVLKKSAVTLTQTWGESLIGYAGVSFGSGIVLGLSLLWLALGVIAAIVLKVYWLVALVFVTWLVAIFAFSYLMSIASQVFRCALYLYATEGAMPAPYSADMAELAWRTKKR